MFCEKDKETEVFFDEMKTPKIGNSRNMSWGNGLHPQPSNLELLDQFKS